MAAPDLLLITWESDQLDRFHLIGRYSDGNQYMAFVTGAFPADWWSGSRPADYLRLFWAEHKRWYAVLHRFDAAGKHLGTEVRSGGTTADGESQAIERAAEELEGLLAMLGPREPCDIAIRPFEVEVDGYMFGLIYECVDAEGPDSSATHEYVMLQPNDVMFHPPWDSGEYST
ncbi:MAG: hypothetical protein K8T91_12210 [Planctomycetes bacterium]|nr:hypothetical protein [Planctomycetota bacterium]